MQAAILDRRREPLRLLTSVLLAAAALQAQVGRKEPIPPRPPVDAQEIAQGKRLFDGHCAACHGPEGRGAQGPNLAVPDLTRARGAQALFLVIDLGIPGTEMPRGGQLHDSEIWKIAAYVESIGQAEPEPLPGDPQAGKRLYAGKGNCAACHWLDGGGGRQGPELSGIGSRRSLAHLRQSLTDPAASVSADYLPVTAVVGGRRIRGIRLNEDPFTIQIRDSSDALLSMRKAGLDALDKHKGESSMPPYGSVFSDAELDDLVSYLASLRRSR